jgi:hypothetical protein
MFAIVVSPELIVLDSLRYGLRLSVSGFRSFAGYLFI